MKRRKIFGIVLLVGVAAFITVLAAQRPTRVETADPTAIMSNGAQLVDARNNPLDFTAFEGKVVFVNNWASWCPPCIAEMPTIQELKGKLKGENIVFVMVSFDDKPDKATAFMKRKGFDFDVYFPGQNYPYPTASIPATFILNKKGEVVSQHVGMADYSSDELANELEKLANE